MLRKFQELEKQTIYFASPEELNDPMEGLRDIVWDGDESEGHYFWDKDIQRRPSENQSNYRKKEKCPETTRPISHTFKLITPPMTAKFRSERYG